MEAPVGSVEAPVGSVEAPVGSVEAPEFAPFISGEERDADDEDDSSIASLDEIGPETGPEAAGPEAAGPEAAGPSAEEIKQERNFRDINYDLNAGNDESEFFSET